MSASVLDTSVAVPYLVASHAHHEEVSSAMDALVGTGCLSAQSLAETYSVLTRLPGDARVSAADAARLIEANFDPPIAVAKRTINRLPMLLAAAGVSGGATYDALVALAAKEAGLTLLTRDVRATATYFAIGVSFEVIASKQ